MSAYLKKPNVHALVQMRALLNQGKLTANDQRLMAIYEQMVRGKRRQDGSRVIKAVSVLLGRHGVGEEQIAKAASAQKKRLGKAKSAPPKPVVQPTEQRKQVLATLQRAHASLPPQEQEYVSQYVDILGGRVKVSPEKFREIEKVVLGVYYSVAETVRDEAQQLAERYRDEAVEETPLQKLHALSRGVTLLGSEDDISWIQGLCMSEEMGLLQLDEDTIERINKLHNRMAQSQVS